MIQATFLQEVPPALTLPACPRRSHQKRHQQRLNTQSPGGVLELIRKRISLITQQILERGMLSRAEQPSHLPLGRHPPERRRGNADPAPQAAPRTCKTTKYLQPKANTPELQRCHLNAPKQEHLVPATDSLIIQAMPQSQGWLNLACHGAPASTRLSDMSSSGSPAPPRL